MDKVSASTDAIVAGSHPGGQKDAIGALLKLVYAAGIIIRHLEYTPTVRDVATCKICGGHDRWYEDQAPGHNEACPVVRFLRAENIDVMVNPKLKKRKWERCLRCCNGISRETGGTCYFCKGTMQTLSGM